MALVSRAVGRRKPQPGGPTATPIPAARSEKPSSEDLFERDEGFTCSACPFFRPVESDDLQKTSSFVDYESDSRCKST